MDLHYIRGIDQSTEILIDGTFASLCNLTSDTTLKCLGFAGNEEYIKMSLKKDNISCLIVPYAFRDNAELRGSGKGVLLSENPMCTFHMIHNYLSINKDPNYIPDDFETRIGSDCMISDSASISKQNVIIGNHVVIEENVLLRGNVEIGDHVVIKAGTIIGYDACLAGRDKEGNLLPLCSVGRVKIEHNVQIGSYSIISKGLFPYEITEVKEYSLVGCMVDLSHNSHTGKNVIILDQSQICGNTVIEDNAHISPQVIVSNRLKIGEKADVAIGSVVVNNVKKGLRVAGNYAIENSKFLLWHRNKLRVK